MPYLIYALDHKNMSEQRESIRNDHRKHLKSYGSKILASGALLDDEENVIGGITLLDTDSRVEAVNFEKCDPYSKIRIREEVHIIKWRKRWWNGSFLLKDIEI